MSTSSKSKTIGKAATPPVQRSAAQPAKDASSVKPATAVPVVQRKLTVGSANDVYEQQADSMADKVVNMTEADVAVKRREGVKNKSPLAVQAKAQPGAFLFRKSNPVLSPKTDEKLQKAADPELKKKADEKLQKAADPELKKKADEKLQKAADPELKKKADEKLQKAADAELKKKADEKLQKAADAELKKKSEEKQQEIKQEQQKIAFEAGQKIKKKADEKLQKASEPELKKKAEEKIQQTIQRKNAQEQQRQVSNAQVTQQVHEPKQRSHEVTEKDLRRKPEQKEEEKIKKKNEPLKKKAEEKPQKKSEEKVQQKAAVKVQKQAIVQLVRTITAAPPAPRRTAKEEDKIKKKAEEKPQKKAEEKVQKSAEKIARKDGIHPVSPAAAKPLVARTILPKEDDKLKKKADEKLQKAAEEKVQKTEIKPQRKSESAPVAAPIRPKEDEKLKKKPDVQREAETAETSVSPAFEAKLGTEMNGGRAMDAGTKGYMEIRFGVDFGQVRIHTDGTAARLCNEIGAQAFAYKNHIFFNSGKYRPDSQSGRFLLAHELTHVIQQGYALHKSEDKEKPAISKTAEKKPQRTVTHSGPRVQRLGWDTVNNAVRRVVPVWTLLTVIMGYNPILGESVTRNATAWFNGLLDLIPVVGPSIFDKLQSSGIMGRVQQWFDGVFAELPTYNEVNSTWDRCWEAMGITEGIDGNIAIFRNHFSPLITRIVNFGTKVFNKVVEFLRETLLRPLDNVIKDIPGWELITVLIGTNPLTGERKERTAMNVMRGVVAFIPGGQEKLDQLVQSRALEKAFLWFNTETTARNLTWERIKNTFKSAFDTLQASDILHPIDTFRRLAGIFSPLLRDLVGFAGAALEKLLEFIFETVMGAGGALVLSTLKKVRSTFLLVIRDPVGFLRNLVRGVGQGVQQFGRNILTHLRDGVIAWLTGPIAAAGVQMPERWDLKGFIWFGLQIMGLTWDKIKQRMIAKLGERVVNALETGFEFIMEVREKGIVKALKDRISEFFGGLRDQLLNKIKSFIQEKIVTAGIQQLLALLSPVGAVIDAILKTYNTIMFFIDNIRRILEFVNSVLDSITAIATGNLGQAASFIERTMARTIPILLDFLARFLNLGNVAKKVQDAIKALQDWVGSKVDAVIEWVKKTALRVMTAGTPLDPVERLNEGMNAAKVAVNRFAGRRVGKLLLNPVLSVIKARYQFKSLEAVPDGQFWKLEGEINPKKSETTQVKVEIDGEVKEFDITTTLGNRIEKITTAPRIYGSVKSKNPANANEKYPQVHVVNIPVGGFDEDQPIGIATKYRDESYATKDEADRQVGIVVGFNVMATLDNKAVRKGTKTGTSNEEVISQALARAAGWPATHLPLAAFGFIWEPDWMIPEKMEREAEDTENRQARTRNTGPKPPPVPSRERLKPVKFSKIKEMMDSGKLEDEEKEKIKKKEEKVHNAYNADKSKLPYGIFRDTIKNHGVSATLVGQMRPKAQQIFVSTQDPDVVTLRVVNTRFTVDTAGIKLIAEAAAKGLFEGYAKIIEGMGGQPPAIITGGIQYIIKSELFNLSSLPLDKKAEAQTLLATILSTELDMAIRRKIMENRGRIPVYFSEQNTLFNVTTPEQEKAFLDASFGIGAGEGNTIVQNLYKNNPDITFRFVKNQMTTGLDERFRVNAPKVKGGSTGTFRFMEGILRPDLALVKTILNTQGQSHAKAREWNNRVAGSFGFPQGREGYLAIGKIRTEHFKSINQFTNAETPKLKELFTRAGFLRTNKSGMTDKQVTTVLITELGKINTGQINLTTNADILSQMKRQLGPRFADQAMLTTESQKIIEESSNIASVTATEIKSFLTRMFSGR